jgi:hypothetical protein
VKAGYLWPECGLIWVEADLLRSKMHHAPNGIRTGFRAMVEGRKKDRLSCLVDELQDVFQMKLRFRGIRSAMAG